MVMPPSSKMTETQQSDSPQLVKALELFPRAEHPPWGSGSLEEEFFIAFTAAWRMCESKGFAEAEGPGAWSSASLWASSPQPLPLMPAPL